MDEFTSTFYLTLEQKYRLLRISLLELKMFSINFFLLRKNGKLTFFLQFSWQKNYLLWGVNYFLPLRYYQNDYLNFYL